MHAFASGAYPQLRDMEPQRFTQALSTAEVAVGGALLALIGIAGVDTRALTARIREQGTPNGVIAHEPSGKFNLDALKKEAREWPGLVGMDLVPMVTSAQRFTWDETPWLWGQGFGRQTNRR